MPLPTAAPSDSEPIKKLPQDMQRVLQLLCDTYESLDLRIETTPAQAETDFLRALPEIEGHDDDLRKLVAVLIADLRGAAKGTEENMVILKLAFKDEADLAEQFLAHADMRKAVA